VRLAWERCRADLETLARRARARVRTCVHAWTVLCTHACVRSCAHACMRGQMCGCVECVHACSHAQITGSSQGREGSSQPGSSPATQSSNRPRTHTSQTHHNQPLNQSVNQSSTSDDQLIKQALYPRPARPALAALARLQPLARRCNGMVWYGGMVPLLPPISARGLAGAGGGMQRLAGQ
jgi:hypothetical protein